MADCSCDNFPGNLSVQGNLGVGGSATELNKLNIGATFNTPADVRGLYLNACQTVPADAATLRGISCDTLYSGAGPLAGLHAADLTFYTFTGHISAAKAVRAAGVLAAGASVGDVRMVDIAAPAKDSAAFISTLYGIHLGNMNAGLDNWAIYSEGGPCSFAGNFGIGIGSNVPAAKLHVRSSTNGEGGNVLFEDSATGAVVIAARKAANSNYQLMNLHGDTISLTAEQPTLFPFSLILDPAGLSAVGANSGGSFSHRIVNGLGQLLYA